MSSNTITSLNARQLPASIQEFRSLGNPLTHIADDALADSRDLLDTLVIMNSDLTSVPKAIGTLTALTKLYLNYNSKLSDASTSNFPATTTDLYLNSNALTSLPTDSFKDLPLRILHVDFNKIKSIDKVVFPSSLKSLYASDNDIEVISSLKFPTAAPELEVLALFNNPLTSIDRHAFNSLQRLTTLSLTGSKLTRLPLALTDLPALTHLNMWNIRSLVCTCAELDVATWYSGRNNKLRVDGECGNDKIKNFFDNLAPQCATPATQ